MCCVCFHVRPPCWVFAGSGSKDGGTEVCKWRGFAGRLSCPKGGKPKVSLGHRVHRRGRRVSWTFPVLPACPALCAAPSALGPLCSELPRAGLLSPLLPCARRLRQGLARARGGRTEPPWGSGLSGEVLGVKPAHRFSFPNKRSGLPVPPTSAGMGRGDGRVCARAC